MTDLVPGFEPGFGGIPDVVAECPAASQKFCGFHAWGRLVVVSADEDREVLSLQVSTPERLQNRPRHR